MFRLRHGLPTLLSFGIGLLMTQPSLAAQWQSGVNYGGSVNMNLYIPDSVDESPGIVVALHSCGNQYESDSQNYVKTSADQYGFIIIQPTNGSPDCWTSDAGQAGEKPDILNMVQYVIDNHSADPNRVFAVGASSGACMTMALLATSPNVFAGGASLAGVPYGGWSAGGNCSVCSQQPATKSEEEWGNVVRQNAPSGYDGPWPRVQLWHGTSDPTLLPGWLAEAEKQWKNVHGLTGSGTSASGPSGWTRTEYTKDGSVVLQVNSGAGKDHYLPDDVPQADIVTFFGLDQDTPVNPGTGGAGGETGTAGNGNSSGNASTGGIANTGGGSNTGGVANTGGASGDGTCVAGVQTGSVCDPEQDTDVCVRTDRECVCGADSLWACTQTGDGSGGADTGAGGSQTGTGGVPTSGGASGALTGGVTSISTGGSTGTPGTGGIGAIVPATGGTSATTPSTGGASTSPPATGGTSATTPSTGGSSATPSGTGGTSAASPATGGALSGVSTGGSTASAAGGSVPTDADTSSGSDDGGCSCRLGGGTNRQSRGALVAVGLIGLAMLRRGRRARS